VCSSAQTRIPNSGILGSDDPYGPFVRGGAAQRPSCACVNGERSVSVNACRRTHGEDTATILQEAAHNGTQVLIPGAFELRVSRPEAVQRAPSPRPTVFQGGPSVVTGTERIAIELEGGGAPSQRRTPGRPFIARLLRLLARRPQSQVEPRRGARLPVGERGRGAADAGQVREP
jgi:hypothetical protein